MPAPFTKSVLRACALGVALSGAVALGAPPLGAQEAECDLPPVTLPLFDATPAATVAATLAVSQDAPEPDVAEVEQAAQRIMACANSASQAERYAIFTNRLLATVFLGENAADQPAFERRIATGMEPEPGAFVLEHVRDIEQQDDGRVAVTLHIATPDAQVTDRVLLAWNDEADGWLIDGILSLDAVPNE